MPHDADGFERLARLEDLPAGTLLAVTRADGERICLVNCGGSIAAMSDTCTHSAFPMSEGSVEADGTVQCSWHGARFDCRTGAVRQGPAVDPIAVYAVRVRDGGIWVGDRL
jgi:3-phenylpropionate/trans-cinnamate dioxygenase ferredoxin subunit